MSDDRPKLPRLSTAHDLGKPKQSYPQGVPVGEFDKDVDTGTIADPTLRQTARRRQSPETRLDHHDERLDQHSAELAALKLADAQIMGDVRTGNAILVGHTSILTSQSSQLERLLAEKSAVTVATTTATVQVQAAQQTAVVERGTIVWKTVWKVLGGVLLAVIGYALHALGLH